MKEGQGALPPEPPAKAEPLQSIRLEWLDGRGACLAAAILTTCQNGSSEAGPLPSNHSR